MRRFLSLVVVGLLLATLSGCGKKQEMEELQPITMESLSTPMSAPEVSPEAKAPEAKALSAAATVETKEVVPLPPQGPFKPANIEIQTALKNAGYYNAKIDGSIGPKSKKAIKDFQSANGLKVDGKVGPKTWEVLGRYLNMPAEPSRQ